MSIIKKAVPFLIIFLLLLIIRNNILTIFNTLSNTNTTKNLSEKLSNEKKENRYLQEQLKYVKTDQFVENQAQTNLGLLQAGEYFVIAPTPAAQNNEMTIIDTRPNWQKWLDLFF